MTARSHFAYGRSRGTDRLHSVIAAVLMCGVCACTQSRDPGLYAIFETNKGTFVASLEYNRTPMTVVNFVGLAEGTINNSARKPGEPYFNGLTFHRVIPGFMIQGGDPEGSGRGGPGYRFADEFHPDLRHSRPGMLSMANAGPGTNGSQFFVTVAPTPHLDNKHSIFGHVIEGMEVVQAIVSVPRDSRDQPNGPVRIEKVTIQRVGDAAKAFKADQKTFTELQQKAEALAKARQEADTRKMETTIKEKWPNAQTTASGLMYVVTTKGSGGKPKPGTKVKAHYTGKLLNGTKFDSSVDRGEPFEFDVGDGMVIRGWDEAFLDMEKGEKRTLIIPPNLGYGPRGMPPVIPPNSHLVFDVELVDF